MIQKTPRHAAPRKLRLLVSQEKLKPGRIIFHSQAAPRARS